MEETLVLHYGISTMEIIRTLSNSMKIVNEVPSQSEA